MKKIIRQDGVKRVFIYDDGSEESFDKKSNKKEKKSKFFSNSISIDEASEILDKKED